MKKLLVIISAIILISCSVTNKPGVIHEGKKGRWVLGNAKIKQQRHDYQLRMDSIKLSKK